VKRSHAVRIALELKKRLVDSNTLDLSQSDMQQVLFELLQLHGYGSSYIQLFQLTTSFHHHRIPLIILIAGTGCIGKSFLARQLAERLNLPSVLQTDIVLSQINMEHRHRSFSIVDEPSVWTRAADQGRNMLPSDFAFANFSDTCTRLYRYVQGDINKSFDEGKSLIIEGTHVLPPLYASLVSRGNAKSDDDDKKNSIQCNSMTTVSTNGLLKTTACGLVVPFFLVLNDALLHDQFLEDWWVRQRHGYTLSDDMPSISEWKTTFEELQRSMLATLPSSFCVVELQAGTTNATSDKMIRTVLDHMQSYVSDHAIV
jgi:hypothetical protein